MGASSVAIRSFCRRRPLVVAWPAWSTLTLIVTGTPASGPTASPRASAASMAAARASTWSGRQSTMALMRGLTAATRASAAWATSVALTARPCTRAAVCAADRRHSSVEAVMRVSCWRRRARRVSLFPFVPQRRRRVAPGPARTRHPGRAPVVRMLCFQKLSAPVTKGLQPYFIQKKRFTASPAAGRSTRSPDRGGPPPPGRTGCGRRTPCGPSGCAPAARNRARGTASTRS